MLITNIDVSDRPINDQLGYIYEFAKTYRHCNPVTNIYILSLMIMRLV